MKQWFKKIFKGEPTKDIIMSIIFVIVGSPGIILTFIGMFMDDSRLKDYGIVCMADKFIINKVLG